MANRARSHNTNFGFKLHEFRKIENDFKMSDSSYFSDYLVSKVLNVQIVNLDLSSLTQMRIDIDTCGYRVNEIVKEMNKAGIDFDDIIIHRELIKELNDLSEKLDEYIYSFILKGSTTFNRLHSSINYGEEIVRKHIRLSEAELLLIENKMKTTNISVLNTFVRRALLNNYIFNFDHNEFETFFASIGRILNLVMQAKRVVMKSSLNALSEDFDFVISSFNTNCRLLSNLQLFFLGV